MDLTTEVDSDDKDKLSGKAQDIVNKSDARQPTLSQRRPLG